MISVIEFRGSGYAIFTQVKRLLCPLYRRCGTENSGPALNVYQLNGDLLPTDCEVQELK